MSRTKDLWDNSGAVFSDDRIWRYSLYREIVGSSTRKYRAINFLCLNPSKANESEDDNTVRRCIRWGAAWGYTEVVVTNIFAIVSTDPRMLYDADDPIGPDNDEWIGIEADTADLLVCAWGDHGRHLDRGSQVKRLLASRPSRRTVCFGRTKRGQPKHPLYLPNDAKLEGFSLE